MNKNGSTRHQIRTAYGYEGSALGEFFHGKSITIHASGRRYRFFVKKPAEIQQAIFEQRYRLQQQQQSQ